MLSLTKFRQPSSHTWQEVVLLVWPTYFNLHLAWKCSPSDICPWTFQFYIQGHSFWENFSQGFNGKIIQWASKIVCWNWKCLVLFNIMSYLGWKKKKSQSSKTEHHNISCIRLQSFWKFCILSNILNLEWCLPNKWKIHSAIVHYVYLPRWQRWRA